jgi:membrane protein implicated in regulation of membrane protease activity
MDIVFWHWLILGFLLLAGEVLVPGTFLMWPGIAAILTGILAYASPSMGWELHALFFAVATVVAAAVGRAAYARLRNPVSDEPNLNRRGAQIVGTIHTLETALVDGRGRMRVGDSTWSVSGPDLPAGTRVRVVAAQGIVLTVEKVEA